MDVLNLSDQEMDKTTSDCKKPLLVQLGLFTTVRNSKDSRKIYEWMWHLLAFLASQSIFQNTNKIPPMCKCLVAKLK